MVMNLGIEGRHEVYPKYLGSDEMPNVFGIYTVGRGSLTFNCLEVSELEYLAK